MISIKNLHVKTCSVFGTAIFASAVLNLLVPEAARIGYGALMILRIFQGLVEVNYISCFDHTYTEWVLLC